jgi:hypothetical protein
MSLLVANSGGMSIAIPAAFTVTEEGAVLNAQSSDGAILTVTPAHSKADVGKVMSQANDVLQSSHVDMGPSHDGKRAGIEVTYAEGKCVMHDVPVGVTLAVFNHAQEYLVCQLLLVKKAAPKYGPIMKKVFGSIAAH